SSLVRIDAASAENVSVRTALDGKARNARVVSPSIRSTTPSRVPTHTTNDDASEKERGSKTMAVTRPASDGITMLVASCFREVIGVRRRDVGLVRIEIEGAVPRRMMSETREVRVVVHERFARRPCAVVVHCRRVGEGAREPE